MLGKLSQPKQKISGRLLTDHLHSEMKVYAWKLRIVGG